MSDSDLLNWVSNKLMDYTISVMAVRMPDTRALRRPWKNLPEGHRFELAFLSHGSGLLECSHGSTVREALENRAQTEMVKSANDFGTSK